MVFTAAGELILLDACADSLAILDRQKVFERDVSLYQPVAKVHPWPLATRKPAVFTGVALPAPHP
ncbi:MAG: hypothetical protein ACOYK7_09510 [Pirellulales bacterium]